MPERSGFTQSLLFCPLHLVDRLLNALTFPTYPNPNRRLDERFTPLRQNLRNCNEKHPVSGEDYDKL